ncbi:MAG: hypothetical protein Q4D61_04370 [Cardiobacteriaceae bacterium]|nr:hypothetical protein [Cardiobacteriaceae bacterium]
MNLIHINGHTVNPRHITWIAERGNILLIHFITYTTPLHIPFASADECRRAHRELLAQLEQRP